MKELFDTSEDEKESANVDGGKVLNTNAKRELKRLCPKQKELSAKTKRLVKKFDEAAQTFGLAVDAGRLDYTAAVCTDAYVKHQVALLKHLLKLEQRLELLGEKKC